MYSSIYLDLSYYDDDLHEHTRRGNPRGRAYPEVQPTRESPPIRATHEEEPTRKANSRGRAHPEEQHLQEMQYSAFGPQYASTMAGQG